MRISRHYVILKLVDEIQSLGKHNRKGCFFTQFTRTLLDLDDALSPQAWLVAACWSDGASRPDSNPDNAHERAERKTRAFRYCIPCKSCSVKTVKATQGPILELRSRLLAMHNLATGIKGQSSMELRCDLERAHRLAWFLTLRIYLTGETYNGPFGCPLSIHPARRSRKERSNIRDPQPDAGGEPVRAGPAVDIKARAMNEVRTERIESVKCARDVSVNDGAVDNEAVCMARRSWFRRLQEHESVNHGLDPYIRYQGHLHTLRSFRSTSKLGCYSTDHKGSEEDLGSSVREFVGLRDDRRLNRVDQMRAITHAVAGKLAQIPGRDRISCNRRVTESEHRKLVRRPTTQSWARSCEGRVASRRGSDYLAGYSPSVPNLPTEGEIA